MSEREGFIYCWASSWSEQILFFSIIVNFSFTITHQYTRKAVAFSLCYLEKIKVFLGIFQTKIAMKLTKKKYSDENQMPAFGSRSFVLAAPRKPHATQSSLDVRSFYPLALPFHFNLFFFFNSSISIYFVISFVFFFFFFLPAATN